MRAGDTLARAEPQGGAAGAGTEIADALGALEARSGAPTLRLRPMFGWRCLMPNGPLLAGVRGDAVLYRVGKDQMAAALAIAGTAPLASGTRTMRGGVQCADTIPQGAHAALARMARDFVGTLPPK